MTRLDKAILWGAWAAMVVVGILSFRAISSQPMVEAWVVNQERRFEAVYSGRVRPSDVPPVAQPPKAEKPIPPVTHPTVPVPIHPWAGFIQTKFIGIGVPATLVPCLVLPVALPSVQSDLSGVTLTWTLGEAETDLTPRMFPVPSKEGGFIVYRRTGDRDEERIATLKADARSFLDASVEPLKTYHYRVAVTGKETDRTTLNAVPSIREIGYWAETRTPSATKVKLVGGDQAIAFLRIETYDRAQKKYVSRMVQTPLGQPIGGSGWTLKGLRFDNFTLVADVMDDDGVARVLTTKN